MYMLPEQFRRIKVTYSEGDGAKQFFVGADTRFGLPIPEEKEGYEFCGYESNGVLYTDVVDGRIVLSSGENITLTARFEKIPETTTAPENIAPETSSPSSDGEVNAPADTYEQWLESLPPEVTEGCASFASGSASVVVICMLGALIFKKKKYK